MSAAAARPPEGGALTDALQRLAAALGIADGYDDIWGRRHATSDATRAALAQAMGHPAGDADEAERSLDALERARWRDALAPLTVVRAGAPLVLAVRLPATVAGDALVLRIEPEDGAPARDVAVTAQRGASAAVDGAPRIAWQLCASAPLPLGYHRIEVRAGSRALAAGRLAVAPPACWRPPSLQAGGRTWGVAVQLYGVRSARNWGIGDFSDLAALARLGGPSGFGAVGVNPLHALFAHNPRHCSPYSPSSRRFLNVLYIDVAAVADFAECADAQATVASEGFQRQLTAWRAAERVDYAGVGAAKLAVLRTLYAHFRRCHLATRTERARAFDDFVAAGGEPLRRHAVFEALQSHLHAQDAAVWGWPAWPEALRDPSSEAVARFATEHAEDVGFHLYLQWQAGLQLRAAAGFARAARLAVGLYVDLAVSVDRGGAETWSYPGLYADATIGAPPDEFNPAGQAWGLPPMIPAQLRALGYAPFIETLRACMRHAGALRLDHVMGLQRLFWVPTGRTPADGAYVHYPFDDLLGLLALESHRHRCLVIGEDLGTVPDSVRAAMQTHDVLSYRVLPFERGPDGEFLAPPAYPERALVTSGTHDMPTLAGWWAGRDIDARRQAGITRDDGECTAQHAARRADRARLVRALQAAGTLAERDDAEPPAALPSGHALAVQRLLAATPAALLIVQPEDIFGAEEQANLPGTTDAHPNWQRALELPLERWADDLRFVALVDALRPLRADPRPAVATVPRATYRLQLHGGFTFRDATALVPYLDALGVSHVYCSPYLRARAGSRHGYDIVDHGALNPEIGTRADFDAFVAALRQHGMGHIADVVPNHMAVMGADNAWWMEVLEHGPASRYAHFFDIDWRPFDADLAGRVLVPALGTPYGEALEGGAIVVRFEPASGAVAAWYHAHRFPLDARTVPDALDAAGALLEPDAAARLAAVLDALRAIPPRDALEQAGERRRLAAEARLALARLAQELPAVTAALGRALAALSEGAGIERLHALLEAQAFRLAYWRVAFDEINYRRFFDINELAALRMEQPDVFEVTHGPLLDLVAEGMIDGLRIDHPDGLADPAAYFAAVQAGVARRAGVAPEAGARPVYLVAEKIIAPHESLPAWPVHGTTGYRFANAVNGLLVDDAARARIDRTWRAFAGAEAGEFEAMAHGARRAMIRGPLAAGLTALAAEALRLARSDRHTRDHTLPSLRQGLEAIAASFPVYRTYVAAGGPGAQDRRYIDWAIARARHRSRLTDREVFDFLHRLLLGEPPAAGVPPERCLAFAMRFQQFCAPVAAKGIEDTAFYRFNRLVSLADVGGDPDQFGMTVRAFHGASGDRAARWPATMLATSTHDNKRSEDVRARIDVLSEVPAAWRLTLRRWARFNRRHKRAVDEAPAPSRNDELLLYQTLIGTVPANGAVDAAYRDRIVATMTKAVREAKVHTSWIAPDDAYEAAVTGFVEAILAPGPNLFLDDLRRQAPFFAWFGLLNSVTLALVKLTSPGVPDLYQGNELADFSLVDPDNRRAVDYAARRERLRALAELARAPAAALAGGMASLFAAPDGRAKLWTIMRLLGFRRAHAALFERGDYRPLRVSGFRERHAIAYARTLGDEALVVIAGRLFAGLAGTDALPLGATVWNDTGVELPAPLEGMALTDVLTGATLRAAGTLRLAEAWRAFPGAVLHGRRAG